MEPLNDTEIDEALNDLVDWRYEDGKLRKDFKFADFAEAIRFMSSAAPEIDAANHHPAWTNVYNKVSVACCTHDAGDRVTVKDVKLATLLDRHATGS